MSFKNCISQACLQWRCRFSDFAQGRGLIEFLIDAEALEAPQAIAVSALVELCRDGASTHDYVVCTAVVDFLDEEIGQPIGDPQALRRTKDLLEIIRNEPNETAYGQWVKSWYGDLPRRIGRF